MADSVFSLWDHILDQCTYSKKVGGVEVVAHPPGNIGIYGIILKDNADDVCEMIQEAKAAIEAAQAESRGE